MQRMFKISKKTLNQTLRDYCSGSNRFQMAHFISCIFDSSFVIQIIVENLLCLQLEMKSTQKNKLEKNQFQENAAQIIECSCDKFTMHIFYRRQGRKFLYSPTNSLAGLPFVCAAWEGGAMALEIWRENGGIIEKNYLSTNSPHSRDGLHRVQSSQGLCT